MSELSTPMAPVFPVESWVRSSFCGPNGGNCVEVNRGAGSRAGSHTGVRDSKPAVSPVLVFAAAGWANFVEQVRADRFAS